MLKNLFPNDQDYDILKMGLGNRKRLKKIK